MILSPAELESFLQARQALPHQWLGVHPCRYEGRSAWVARAFLPGAAQVEWVELDAPEKPVPAERLAAEGFFEVLLPRRRRRPGPYQWRVTGHDRVVHQFHDPYAFGPTLSEQDLYLFNEGTEYRIYDKLGGHPRVVDGVPGVSFAVWAPNAERVSVVGTFNRWDGRVHPMRALGHSGVWELFVPGIGPGAMYKYEILGHGGRLKLKTDPYGSYFEGPPNNASIVHDLGAYRWGDGEWMQRRRAQAGRLDRPISVYEVHPGSWRRDDAGGRPLDYRELADRLGDYAVEMGFTHVELMPVAEHPFDGSWGYQVTGFYAPTHRYGTPDDFRHFVDRLHQRGIGVILDWVPAHFPRDAFALEHFDGTHLYEHEDPRLGAHQDWGTLIFNYGRNEVRLFLVANALAWCERYHIDGLRVDAVASMLYLDYSRKSGEWLPNRLGGNHNLDAIAFLRQANEAVHREHPGVLMIAEESTAFAGVSQPVEQGGLGFDMKWNMGWMHDTLRYFSKDPIHRRWHQHDLTFGALYQWSERFVSVFSHDEVVHGKGSMLAKMPAPSIAGKAQQLRALYGHLWAWPGKKLLFMGSEFGQSNEWYFAGQLDWSLLRYADHEGLRLLVRDLNRIYAAEPALWRTDFEPESFRWVSIWDADASVLAYLRQDAASGDMILVVGHYSGSARDGYRIGVPRPGQWREILNTNSAIYGGNNAGNLGGVRAEPVVADRCDHSLRLHLPAHTTLLFKWEPEPAAGNIAPSSQSQS